MQLLYIVMLFFCNIPIIYATEYIYPVAYLPHENSILYIHQHTPTNIELYSWHTKTQTTEPLLWSLFNPAGLQLLPSHSGFSFIDNGRLRIKSFQKRSPKAIDFDDPISNINNLRWIDDNTCYCSGQQGNHFALFQLHDDGTMDCLLKNNTSDYMYPQKINDLLFYIERYALHNSYHYRIMQTAYIINNQNSCSQEMVNFADKPIIFLSMLSAQEGFVIEHESSIDDAMLTTQFLYYHLVKEGDHWYKKRLFSFHIPLNLLLRSGDQQLYESLLPLIPGVVEHKIYFVDCVQLNNYNLEPYYYDLNINALKKIKLPKKEGHYFVPMLCNTHFYCGGTKISGQQNLFTSFFFT